MQDQTLCSQQLMIHPLLLAVWRLAAECSILGETNLEIQMIDKLIGEIMKTQ